MSKDVKRMLGEIRQSLDAYPREQLVEILSYVFKEYVVEGAAPIAGTTALIDARTELEGLSFAELMTWLQLHLDVPELAQFEVQGTRVSLRSGGRALPIEAAPAPQPLPPVAPPPPQPAPVAAPSVTTRPMPAPQAQPQSSSPQASQPAQNRQPSPPQNQPQAAPNQQPQNQPSPNQPAAPSQNQQQPEKKDEAGSPASRFSWLEVD